MLGKKEDARLGEGVGDLVYMIQRRRQGKLSLVGGIEETSS
jgi:hypothetical protein